MTPLTELAEEERIFAETVRQFAEDVVGPRVRAMDEAGRLDADIVSRCFEMGLMGIQLPERYGGSDASFFLACLAVEELSRVDPSVAVLVDVQNTLFNNCLLRWGTPEQVERYAPRMAAETLGAYALSEASAGSDAFALKTRAEKQGDAYVLNGSKLWTTNGEEAGVFVVFANVDPDAGYKGITAFLVERGLDGFSVGRKEDKLGIRASSTTELRLENCRVPELNRLGEPGKGYKIAIETLNEGRIGIGAQMVGCAQGALDAALDYGREREAFGRHIVDFQAVQFELAEMATQLEAARLMVYNAARLRDAGKPFRKQAAMAKLFTSRMAERVTSAAVELFGGYGYTRDYPVEKLYRDAKIGAIYEGTSNMQLATIARSLLEERDRG